MMRFRKVTCSIQPFLIAAFLAAPIPASAQVNPSLAQVLLGTWQYSYGGAVMGTIRFDGLTGGTIYDNRYGTGTFTGKFASSNVFQGLALVPKRNPNSQMNLVVDFYHPQNSPSTWSFTGWVSDYSNGSFAQGKKQ